jgi:hypothetical protein
MEDVQWKMGEVNPHLPSYLIHLTFYLYLLL